jgi:hypothetical protein
MWLVMRTALTKLPFPTSINDSLKYDNSSLVDGSSSEFALSSEFANVSMLIIDSESEIAMPAMPLFKLLDLLVAPDLPVVR